MLETSTIARIDQIASDRISGATELALRASEALSLTPAEELLEAAMAVVRAQPAMASVYNAAQAAIEGRLEEFVDRIRRSGDTSTRRSV